jgi:hypothetical protein
VDGGKGKKKVSLYYLRPEDDAKDDSRETADVIYVTVTELVNTGNGGNKKRKRAGDPAGADPITAADPTSSDPISSSE